LYLLIFQQLGQLVRWTWGFNVLLAPASAYKDEDDGTTNGRLENGSYDETQNLLDDSHSDYESGNITPEFRRTYAASESSSSCSSTDAEDFSQREVAPDMADFATPTNGNVVGKSPKGTNGGPVHRPSDHGAFGHGSVTNLTAPKGPKGWWIRFRQMVARFFGSISNGIARVSQRSFAILPQWLQRSLTKMNSFLTKFLLGLWEFMNPPLWAMLAAIIVASVPKLQHLFFDPGTFISNSATRAISQSGQVAVPLILVVLGANLARNTLSKEDQKPSEDPSLEKKLLIASLVSRMLIPTIIMAPLLAITAKFVPVSILDDPIFVIVCFLLTGAPSALQLAQICQINNVYMGAMSKLLFHSYVVWILPSTLVLVMLALETVEWAQAV
jgi:choline kinase